MTKPYTITVERPLSWSAISSFEYDPEQWYRRYVLGEKDAPSREMIFGKQVGERLASDPTYLPEVPRYPIFEHGLKTKWGELPLIGFVDGYDPTPPTPALGEYKTGKRAWDQKRADTHGQIDMYLLMLWLTSKIKPESVQCFLHWMPTQEHGDFTIDFVSPFQVHTLPTKRTMVDILRFGERINQTYAAMQEYANNHV